MNISKYVKHVKYFRETLRYASEMSHTSIDYNHFTINYIAWKVGDT